MAVKQGTVLVIDDDETLAKFVHKLLTLEGYTVVTASDGRTGLVAVQQYEPHLILLDVGLPVLDGQAFLAIYSSQTRIQAPVIIMTGQPYGLLSIRYVASALQKLFQPQMLIDLVEKHIASGEKL
jgi:DNA-binding response OmpR family regulator